MPFSFIHSRRPTAACQRLDSPRTAPFPLGLVKPMGARRPAALPACGSPRAGRSQAVEQFWVWRDDSGIGDAGVQCDQGSAVPLAETEQIDIGDLAVSGNRLR